MKTSVLSILMALTVQHSTGQYPDLAGYRPLSNVVDEAAIDLDQQAMQQQLDSGDFLHARNIYMHGGNSFSVAYVTLHDVQPHPEPYPVGTLVHGKTRTGHTVRGSLHKTVSWTTSGDVSILIPYHITSEQQQEYLPCRVGGFYSFGQQELEGCFNDTGSLYFQTSLLSPPTTYNYFYNVTADNSNLRSLSRLETEDERVSASHPEYETFVAYYGMPNYGDHLIESTFDQVSTEFLHSNIDTSFFRFRSSRAVIIKRATVVMNVWMHVVEKIRESEDKCRQSNDHNGDNNMDECGELKDWDAAMAFYVGSLVQADEEDSSDDQYNPGNLLFHLADEMCVHFKTCGSAGVDESGTAWANSRVRQLFEIGQNALLEGCCTEQSTFRQLMVPTMLTPLIQGALWSAYRRSTLGSTTLEERAENDIAESVVFGAAILPMVHACSPEDARILSRELLDVTNTVVDFEAVKAALENTYSCMGISCAEVGGIWEDGEYKAGANPCGDLMGGGIHSTSRMGGIVTATLVITIFFLVFTIFFFWKQKEQNDLEAGGTNKELAS